MDQNKSLGQDIFGLHLSDEATVPTLGISFRIFNATAFPTSNTPSTSSAPVTRDAATSRSTSIPNTLLIAIIMATCCATINDAMRSRLSFRIE